jgi:hypothetical protein
MLMAKYASWVLHVLTPRHATMALGRNVSATRP